LLEPWPYVGSPIVVPNSVALGRLSKPLGAQPSNPWTITGSMPFIAFFRVFKCELGSLVFVLGAGGAPEPSYGARGWSGVPLTFLFDPRTSFSFGRRGFLPSPLVCEPGSLGLGKIVGSAPEPLHGARGRSGVSLAFCMPLAREGLFVEPPSGVSLGRGVSVFWTGRPSTD